MPDDNNHAYEGLDIVVTGAKFHVSSPTAQSTGSSSYFMSAPLSMFQNTNTLYSGLLQHDYLITSETPPIQGSDQEIVVEASREQVEAAQIAYQAAGINIGIAQIMGIIAAGLVRPAYAIGLSVADKVVDLNSDALQSAYADILYYQDGMDGTYDGVAQDSGGWEGYDFRGSGHPPQNDSPIGVEQGFGIPPEFNLDTFDQALPMPAPMANMVSLEANVGLIV